MDEPSRSVALPFPSSPHWAPRTTIAGIRHLFHHLAPSSWAVTGALLGAATASQKAASPRCATASGLLRSNVSRAAPPAPGPSSASIPRTAALRGDSLRLVEPLLLITNSEAGSADERRL